MSERITFTAYIARGQAWHLDPTCYGAKTARPYTITLMPGVSLDEAQDGWVSRHAHITRQPPEPRRRAICRVPELQIAALYLGCGETEGLRVYDRGGRTSTRADRSRSIALS